MSRCTSPCSSGALQGQGGLPDQFAGFGRGEGEKGGQARFVRSTLRAVPAKRACPPFSAPGRGQSHFRGGRVSWRRNVTGPRELGQSPFAGQAPHDFGQIQPIDVLHNQHGRAVDLAGIESLDDVRVGEPADGLHLAFEAADGLAVAHAATGQHLDGHNAIEFHVQCLIDPAHAAAAQFFEDLVFAQGLRNGRR